MVQRQQMSGAATSLADRVRLMVAELEKNKYTKSEILDRVYVKAGMEPSTDPKLVCLLLASAGWLLGEMGESEGERKCSARL